MYLESQVQNITTSLMSMVSVALEPSIYYDVIDLNQRQNIESSNGDDDDDDDDGDLEELTFGGSYLNPLDTRQYLYKLIPKKEYEAEHKKAVSSL